MRLKLLLQKFGFKSVSGGSSPADNGLFSIEQELASLDICWEGSSAGWLLLLTEQLQDTDAFHQLVAVVKSGLMESDDIFSACDDEALTAVIITAISEASNQNGQTCIKCDRHDDSNTRSCSPVCSHCHHGYIPWTDDSRHAFFVQLYPAPYSDFVHYLPLISQITDRLSLDKLAALMSIKGRVEKQMRCEKVVA
ncbi:hypothetical protein [Veronia pacifica]|nr:hypothetical protein [Veronia pacifica]